MNIKKVLSISLAVLMLCTNFGFAAKTKKEELAEVNAERKKVKEELYSKNKKWKEITASIAELDKQIASTQTKLNDLQGQMKNLNTNIKAAKTKIDAAQKEIEENDQLLNQRIRMMYKTSDMTYLQLLLESKSIPDLLSNVYNVQTIVNSDKELLEELERKKNELKEYEEKLLKEKDRMTQVQNTIKSEQAQLAQYSQKQKTAKAAIDKDIDMLERQQKQLQIESNAIEQKILAEMRKSGSNNLPYSGGSMLWPLPIKGTLTSPYSNRVSPITGRAEFHLGQDIAAPAGTSVYAANAGTVITSQYQRSYGNVVVIDHGGGVSTVYAHNSSLIVSPGQTVTKGQTISRVGSTGDSTGNHLHFEVRINGKAVNPMQYFS